MAKSEINQTGVEERINQGPQIDPLERMQLNYENNKKTINMVVTVVLVVVGGYFGYQKLFKEPNEESASKALAMPQLYFQADSMSMALNGDGRNPGFAKIVKKYDGTAGANIAKYYEGVADLKTGNFKGAIKALEGFDGKGTILEFQAYGNLGIAYMEDGNKAKAIEYLKKATSGKEEMLLTPIFLQQLGLIYEANGQTKEAKEAFQRVKDEFPRSLPAREMDKELAKLGQLD